VNTAGTLQLGAETDGGGELDDGGLVGDLLGLRDGFLNALEIRVTVLDVLNVPSVGLEALEDVLSEGALGVTVYICVSLRNLAVYQLYVPMEMWLSS
jgi:hypothetical protein